MDYDFFYRALNANCTTYFGKIPVAVMGGEGMGSSRRFLLDRLREERVVQTTNENNPAWRMFQLLFHALYFPYKTTLASRFDR